MDKLQVQNTESGSSNNTGTEKLSTGSNNTGSDSLAGEIIDGKYQIIELIGTGGMGRVYKAKQILMNQIVAIKILPKELTKQPLSMKRFSHESKAASNIDHVNVVAIRDFGLCKEHEVAYLVMPYVQGNSLRSCLKQERKLGIERALKIFIQICAGLSKAHKQGVVHRDIKPSNIILTEDDGEKDIVKIIDFGIAKVRSIGGSTMLETLTATTETIGSPHYMSPEQCRHDEVDQRSDIYSMGCLMYETLHGETPFNAEKYSAVLMQHITAQPPRLVAEDEDPILVQRLDAIIQKCLAKEASMRYQNVDDLKAHLDKVQLRLNQLNLARTNRILTSVEGAWLVLTRQLRSLFSHLYIGRLTYSKFTVFSICAVIMLIVLLCTVSILGTFGSRYDIQYQPILRESPALLPSKKIASFLLDPEARLLLSIEDAEEERKAGDFRLALSLYDKAESQASKVKNAHKEMTRYWLGRMISCLFLDRPQLTIMCAPVCFGEFAKIQDDSLDLSLAIAHAFYGQALHKIGREKESIAEFQTFTKILEKCLQQGNVRTSDEFAYACGFAGLCYEKQEDLSLSENLLERSGDYWKTIGSSGKYNLAVTHMNLAFAKIKTNQYQEGYDLLENAISDLNQSGEINVGFQNKLRFYSANLRLKMLVPIIPMFS